jgi:hypothetical protein
MKNKGMVGWRAEFPKQIAWEKYKKDKASWCGRNYDKRKWFSPLGARALGATIARSKTTSGFTWGNDREAPRENRRVRNLSEKPKWLLTVETWYIGTRAND